MTATPWLSGVVLRFVSERYLEPNPLKLALPTVISCYPFILFYLFFYLFIVRNIVFCLILFCFCWFIYKIRHKDNNNNNNNNKVLTTQFYTATCNYNILLLLLHCPLLCRVETKLTPIVDELERIAAAACDFSRICLM